MNGSGQCSSITLWLCSHVAMWLCGHVAVWQCGYVAMWLNGLVAIFQLCVPTGLSCFYQVLHILLTKILLVSELGVSQIHLFGWKFVNLLFHILRSIAPDSPDTRCPYVPYSFFYKQQDPFDFFLFNYQRVLKYHCKMARRVVPTIVWDSCKHLGRLCFRFEKSFF